MYVFNFACQSYKTMPMQLTYGLQYGIMILLQVCEPFFASVSIIRLIKSLLVDLSKVWQNTSCPYLIFTVCSLVKVHSTVFDHSNFLNFFSHAERAYEICEN